MAQFNLNGGNADSPTQFNKAPGYAPRLGEVDSTIRATATIGATTIAANAVSVKTVPLVGARPNDFVRVSSTSSFPDGVSILALASQDSIELVVANNGAASVTTVGTAVTLEVSRSAGRIFPGA